MCYQQLVLGRQLEERSVLQSSRELDLEEQVRLGSYPFEQLVDRIV